MSQRRRPQDRLSPYEGPPGGISPQERMRLLVFFALGIVVTGALLYALRLTGGDRPPERPTKGGDEPEIRVEIDVPVHPWKPPVEEVERLLGESSRQLRVQTYPRALTMMATALHNHTVASFLNDPAYEAVGGFERIDVARLTVETAREYRGRPIEVVGRVARVDAVSPSRDLQLSEDAFPFPMQQGVLEVGGNEILFLTVETGVRGSGRLLLSGERVKLRGVFYRMKDVERTWGGEGGFVTLPMMLVKDVLDEVPLRLVETLPEGFGDHLRGLDVSETMVAPQRDPDFYTLLGYVLANREKLLEGPEPRVLRGREPRDAPDDYVLETVRVKGQIAYLKWESFDIVGMREEDAPILGYWHAIVSDPRPEVHVPIQVVFPFDELPPGIHKNVLIDVPAIFFRVHTYDNQGGLESALPMVIALAAPAVRELPPDTTQARFVWTFVVIGLGLLAGLLVMLVRDRTRSRKLDERIRDRRQTRRKSRGFDLNRMRTSPEEGTD